MSAHSHGITAGLEPSCLYSQDDHEKDISMCFSAESEQEYQPPGPVLVTSCSCILMLRASAGQLESSRGIMASSFRGLKCQIQAAECGVKPNPQCIRRLARMQCWTARL